MILHEITFVGSKKVDRDAGIIRGVKILGRESKNGRSYSQAALNEASKLYAGAEVNVNHPDRSKPTSERKIEDGFGWLEGVEVKADGVYGDLHYLREHPAAGLVAEAAERNPKRFGLSHNAEGRVSRKNGKNVVESVEKVLSVDLVQNPATNAGLFESTCRTIREVFEAHDPKLLKLFEDAALLPPETDDQPMMPDGMPEKDPAADIKAAIVALISAAMDGTDDEAAMLQKVALIIATRQAILNGLPKPEADPNAEPGADGEGEMMAGEKGEEGDGEGDAFAEPGPEGGELGPSKEPPAEEGSADAASADDDDNNPFSKRKKPMAEQTTTKKSIEERLNLLESENKQLKEELDLTKLEKHCTKLLQENRREVVGSRLTALARMDNDEQRLVLIEDWPEIKQPEQPARQRAKPDFSAPLREAKGADVRYPEDIKKFVEACRG